jgi:hypothetical protein
VNCGEIARSNIIQLLTAHLSAHRDRIKEDRLVARRLNRSTLRKCVESFAFCDSDVIRRHRFKVAFPDRSFDLKYAVYLSIVEGCFSPTT